MTVAETDAPLQILARPPRSPTQDALRALFRTKSAIVGMAVLSFLVLTAILAPIIAPYDPSAVLIGGENVKKRQPSGLPSSSARCWEPWQATPQAQPTM
jgi:ABC-type dipeptide/oligopeptide/nickel transport system permease subunit